MGILYSILIGGISGWVAEKVMKGDYGLIKTILLGIVGGAVGGWIFSLLGFQSSNNFLPSIITGTVGAVVVIYLYRKIMK